MDLTKFNIDYGFIVCAFILFISIGFMGYSTQDMACEGSSCYVGGNIGFGKVELREHFNIFEWVTIVLSSLAIIDLIYISIIKKKWVDLR